jgi:hypothetical protein
MELEGPLPDKQTLASYSVPNESDLHDISVFLRVFILY